MRNGKFMVWAALLLVVGCGSKKSAETQETTAYSELGAPPARPRVSMPYVIAEAGVRLNPPASWDPDRVEVRTVSGKDADAMVPGADYSVTFDYRAEQPAHHDEPLLTLLVMHKTAWEKASSSVHGEAIDSTGDWVFVASTPDVNPYRRDLLDADQFEAMRLSMDDIRTAFSVEDGGPADSSLRAESNRR
ncbi:MAG TPA: hypothetical protein VFH88_03265 [Candidatus Krumholzibacteria bacterium]|nr:hypothetical protein [Candidatus Krumholzibacteria bacterium]